MQLTFANIFLVYLHLLLHWRINNRMFYNFHRGFISINVKLGPFIIDRFVILSKQDPPKFPSLKFRMRVSSTQGSLSAPPPSSIKPSIHTVNTVYLTNKQDQTNVHFRLIQYDLDDELDTVANYLILSLQTEQIIPQLTVTFFQF